MISAKWSMLELVQHDVVILEVYRGGGGKNLKDLVGKQVAGIWLKRWSWLPTWFPLNFSLDVRPANRDACVRELRRFITTMNTREELWPGCTERVDLPYVVGKGCE